MRTLCLRPKVRRLWKAMGINMKKGKYISLLSGVLAAIILISNNTFVYAGNQVNESNSDYQIYNISSGEISYYSFRDLPVSDDGGYSPGYYPNGYEEILVQDASPMAIVGEDNRQKVQNTAVGPYCNTVYIETTYSNGNTYIGTGFVLGPKAIATAAHCLYNSDRGGYAASVKVVPAKNGNKEPYGSVLVTASADNLIVSSDFIKSSGPNHDWGIILLDTNLGDKTGWLGLKWQSDSYTNTAVYNTGYPAVVNGQDSGKAMYVGTGTVKTSSDNTFKGTWDASAGNSGGPVYAYYSDSGYTAIGILTSGSQDSTNGSSFPLAYSTATRITKDMYNLFVQYR